MADKRLIDADELRQIYKEWLSQLASDEYAGDRCGVETCIAFLDDAPTIDPETLRPKASWEPAMPYDYVWFKCSHCGCVISTDWGENDPDFRWNYCPNCGAKMEE